MISSSRMRLVALCLLAPRHGAIAIVAVDVLPFITLVRRMALVLGGGQRAACSLVSASARP